MENDVPKTMATLEARYQALQTALAYTNSRNGSFTADELVEIAEKFAKFLCLDISGLGK